MFWRRGNKIPVTGEDKKWLESKLNWLRESFSEEVFFNIKTIRPTHEFFDYNFTGQTQDAKYVLKKLINYMHIDNNKIELNVFTDGFVEGQDGEIVSSPAKTKGSWKSVAGTYSKNKDTVIISIEKSQLNDPETLIATMAHELAHELLLGEKRIDENDEYLTDLTAIFFGFGIFIGNSKFKLNGYSYYGGSGWNMSSQRYLPQQMVAYAMAWLSVERKENTNYNIFLSNSMKRYFKRSLKYLQ